MTETNKLIRVGPNRIVSLRYMMKNLSGETVANTMTADPVKFRYGSGEILPILEGALAGLKIGARKSFILSGEAAPGLNGTFHFDVLIDDISWVEDGAAPSAADAGAAGDCGPDCRCQAPR